MPKPSSWTTIPYILLSTAGDEMEAGCIGLKTKKAFHLKEGDEIVTFHEKQKFVSVVSEVRWVRDGFVHIDIDDDCGTLVYGESERVYVNE